MAEARFVQIHTLTAYPGTLLNCDDAGFAKRLPFGGATRTRVSSQCLKYHWRNYDGENALYKLDVPRSVRSRQTFQRRIAQPLVDEGGPPTLVACAVKTLQQLVLSDSKPSKADYSKWLKGDENPMAALVTNQVTIFGEPEVEYLKQLAAKTVDGLKGDLGALWDNSGAEISKEQIKTAVDAFEAISKSDLKKNLKGLGLAAGLDAAMFGRMATSDALARGNAAVHVAHSFTTHAEEDESDYFSAVDELKAEGELGSGHINTSELTSGLFYGYSVVDVPLLVSNLQGCQRSDWQDADRSLAADVLERFIHLVATVSPGAKLGSTAPYAYAECVLVEVGPDQPRTLANAFRKPVETQPDVLANSVNALSDYAGQMEEMYGGSAERRLSGIGPVNKLADALGIDAVVPLDETAQWTAEKIKE